MMKRRDFVIQVGKGLSLMLASKVLLTQNALAAMNRLRLKSFQSKHLSKFNPQGAVNGPGHFLVLYHLGEGADALAGLDPRVHSSGEDEKDFFVPYRSEDRIPFGSHLVGPAAQPLVTHANEIAVINGVMMYRDAGHESLAAFLDSGNPTGNMPPMSAQLSLCDHRGHGGVIVEDPFEMSTIPYQKTLLRDLTEGRLIAEYEEILAAGLIESGESSDFFSELSKKLGEVAKVGSEMGNEQKKIAAENPDAIADLTWLAAAFTSGFSQQAKLRLPDAQSLDSHSNYETDHIPAQKASWQFLADAMTLFKKIPYGTGSLFDHTTFMAYNEFSRTPFLNSAGGKDHNPYTNSVLLAGKGVQGGWVVGESQIITRGKSKTGEALHIAKPFDFETQQAISSGGSTSKKFIDPTHIAATIAQIFKGSIAEGSHFTPVEASVPYLKKLLKK